MAPGHAIETNQPTMVDQVVTEAQDRLDAVVMMLTDPIISFNFTSKDQECLAKNIFYESANEPLEGKVAVGIVTINRSRDDRFPSSICGVVNQKTVLERVRTVTKQVNTMFSVREEKEKIVTKVAVCQFSWFCEGTKRKPKTDDERWIESQQVARELLEGGYTDYRVKYQDAMYFHATRIRPSWASQKTKINRVGGHVFYGERDQLRKL